MTKVTTSAATVQLYHHHHRHHHHHHHHYHYKSETLISVPYFRKFLYWQLWFFKKFFGNNTWNRHIFRQHLHNINTHHSICYDNNQHCHYHWDQWSKKAAVLLINREFALLLLISVRLQHTGQDFTLLTTAYWSLVGIKLYHLLTQVHVWTTWPNLLCEVMQHANILTIPLSQHVWIW